MKDFAIVLFITLCGLIACLIVYWISGVPEFALLFISLPAAYAYLTYVIKD